MKADWRWIMLMLPALVGMRDPFEPPEDKCSAAQLALWHYRGWVESGERSLGLMQDPAGKWLRIKEGQQIALLWTVSAIEKEHVTIALAPECEPREWRWQKEGTINETRDVAVSDAAVE